MTLARASATTTMTTTMSCRATTTARPARRRPALAPTRPAPLVVVGEVAEPDDELVDEPEEEPEVAPAAPEEVVDVAFDVNSDSCALAFATYCVKFLAAVGLMAKTMPAPQWLLAVLAACLQ